VGSLLTLSGDRPADPLRDPHSRLSEEPDLRGRVVIRKAPVRTGATAARRRRAFRAGHRGRAGCGPAAAGFHPAGNLSAGRSRSRPGGLRPAGTAAHRVHRRADRPADPRGPHRTRGADPGRQLPLPGADPARTGLCRPTPAGRRSRRPPARRPDPARSRSLAAQDDAEQGRGSADDSTVGGDGKFSPYRGLAAFGADDAEFFFGRAELTRMLVDRVAAQVTAGGPLVVTGPSGSGKSSLLHAGLVAALRRSPDAEITVLQPKRPTSSRRPRGNTTSRRGCWAAWRGPRSAVIPKHRTRSPSSGSGRRRAPSARCRTSCAGPLRNWDTTTRRPLQPRPGSDS
jgi:ABC-type bacteriocin/lantibiotic exporters, contain an N-terminal double-glycine peptidase domain